MICELDSVSVSVSVCAQSVVAVLGVAIAEQCAADIANKGHIHRRWVLLFRLLSIGLILVIHFIERARTVIVNEFDLNFVDFGCIHNIHNTKSNAYVADQLKRVANMNDRVDRIRSRDIDIAWH